ncbi:MAG TPA: glucokinase [Gammaproteobacteria bacterium]
MRVLAGDVGGTTTRLQLVDFDSPDPRGRVAAEQRFESGRYPSLATLVGEFLDAHPDEPITAACLAVAGPIEEGDQGQRVQLTNLPWHETSAQLADRLAIPHLLLINDLQAAGSGLDTLDSEELLTLQAAAPRNQAPRLLVGAGTGLGVALLTWQQGRYRPLPSEGGHMDFAPASELQWRLWSALQKQYGHVSWERLVSGPGLLTLYRFLLAEQGQQERADAPAAITRLALNGSDAVAVQALDLFVELYGAFAGNLALATLPRGGVFIVGGIAPKIRDRMARGDFTAAFCAKGRHAPLLATLPLYLVTQSDLGLLGAALEARRLLEAR